MRKSLLKICVGLALVSAAIFSSVAAPGQVTLHGHVPAAVSRLQAIGSLPSSDHLQLAIGLPLRNQAGLGGLLEQLYDPASPIYHQFLTPEQFTAQFAPTEKDYQKVIDFAKANGLTIVRTHPNRMLLDVTGTAANIEKTFNVALHVYRHPTENRDFFAPDVDPSVPSGLSIQDISGLDNYRRPHPQYKIKPSIPAANLAGLSTAPAPNATTGSGPGGNYVGNDFRNAYVPGTTLNGSGQTVALVQFDGYLTGDINQYESLFGRTNIPLQNVLIDGFSGLPTGSGGEVEVSLDIEMVISMAPALARVIVYEGNPDNFHPNDVLNQIATDDLAKQVSSSWTWTGGPEATTDQILKQMAVQGQTYFQASTDFDAYPPGTVDSPFEFGTPADNPYVTSVGGTTLTMNGAGASYASETVWNWDIRYGPAADGIGSSGGFSSFYAIPSWQTNINMAARGGSTTTRNFPDVALTGDDTLVIADGGVEYTGVGGTSIAAPLWNGFMSLVNQQAANNGHAPVGFLNPALYSIGNSAIYANCFHDITTGNNEWSGSPNLFTAVAGYDLCTGLGTPNGTNLINVLATSVNPVTHLSPPPPPFGTNLAAMNGSNPNGSWSLFIQDDSMYDSGVISNGWVLALTTANLVGVAADNELLMTASATNIPVGSNVTFTLTVVNYGPSGSTNVLVSDSMPTGFTLVSSNGNPGSVTRSGSTVIWNIGTLATNAGGQATLTMQANNAGSYVNSALVTATTPDPNPDDAAVSANITVGSLAPPTPPTMSGVAVTNGTFQFTITSLPGQTNVVYASTNLANWVPVQTNVGSFTFTDLIASPYRVRFYRDSVTGP